MRFKLKPVDFYLAVGVGKKWYHQEAKDAYRITSDEMPEWMELVLHRGLTSEKTPAWWWVISDAGVGAALGADKVLPVFEPKKLVVSVVSSLISSGENRHKRHIRDFQERLKKLEYVGKKRLVDDGNNVYFGLHDLSSVETSDGEKEDCRIYSRLVMCRRFTRNETHP